MAIYHISPRGNDSLNGKSQTNAWKTIHRINNSPLVPGDSILFETGGIWNEVLTPPTSGTSDRPITYGAYGDGPLPIITGEFELNGWANEGNGIWSKSSPLVNNIKLLTIDGKTQPKGRFPKNEYFKVDSASSPSSNGTVEISSSRLDEKLNFKGAEIIIQEASWIENNGLVISHSGNTISYNDQSTSYNAQKGWGFFFQNHPNCLSEFGDWYFNKVSKKIFFYFGQEKPTNYTIKISNKTTVGNIRKNHLKLSNLDLRYGASEIIALTNAKFNIVENCEIRFGGNYGIKHYDVGGFSDNSIIQNCLIEDTYDHAVSALNSIGVSIRKSIIRRNYVHPGTAGNDDLHGSTIALGINNYRGGNYHVEDNLIEDSGYNAIHFSMGEVLVQNNTIRRACITKVDGGAIYCFGGGESYSNRKIIGNKISDISPISAPNGYNASEQFGIYLDENTQNTIVKENEIYDIPIGIYLHNSKLNVLSNNQIKDFSEAGMLIKSNGSDNPTIDNLISENYFQSEQGSMIQVVSTNDIKDLGTIDRNHYIKSNSSGLFDINYGKKKFNSLASWSSETGFDSHSIHSKIKPSSN